VEIEFPLDCKLNAAEKQMLGAVLDEDESPCDECTWKDSCGGPEELHKRLESIVADGDGRCPVCSEKIVSKVYCPTLAGTFLKCGSGEDFTFELGDTRPDAVAAETL